MTQWLSSDAFVWMVRGSPKTVDYDAMVENIMARARPTIETAQPPEAETGVKKKGKGFGTYIYPHLWVSSRPVFSFQQIMGQMYDGPGRVHRPSEPVYVGRINNAYVAVTNDGFVAIGIKDRRKALRAINTFMALLTLKGISAFAVRESELGDLTIDRRGIGQSNLAIVLPRM